MKRSISTNDTKTVSFAQVNSNANVQVNNTMKNHIFIDEYMTASQLLKERNYLGYCAIVTGGNRGVGMIINFIMIVFFLIL
jgi:hypothetical protein